jgi:hypothetical protein
MKNEKTIAIDIDLTRGLVGLLALALLVAAFGGYLRLPFRLLVGDHGPFQP